MSLKDKLAAKAGDLIDDKAEGWLDELLDEGDKLAAEHAGTLEGGKDAADEALKVLRDNKQPFVRLGKVAFAQVVAAWEDDDEAEARRIYLATKATYAERRAAMHAAGDALVNEEDERKAAWDAVAGVLKRVGTIGLKFLAKLLVGSLAL